MVRFKMTAARARLLFVLKDGAVFWADNEAVSERMRGKQAGKRERSGAYLMVSCLGEVYFLSHIRHLIKYGKWPDYEDAYSVPNAFLVAAASARKKHSENVASGDEYMNDLIEMRLDIMDALIEERQA